MAYEKLLKSVEESADERERELREKALREAEEIRAKAKKEAEEIQENAIREAERSATIERNKMLYLTKGKIREETLKSREEVFLTAVGLAEQQLARLRQDPKYPAVFEKLAREVIGAMGDTSFSIHVDNRDLDLCKRILATMNLRCEILPDIECTGGLVASSPDGRIRISNTLESRLERIVEHRKLEIYAILSGG